jgi:hypothetical protein
MIFDSIASFFQNIINSVPENYRPLAILFLYTIFIAIYSVFVWKFYKFLASRDIIELNLNQYNRSKYPRFEKFFAVLLFMAEYMIILPFLVLFWFAIFSMFLLLLSESQSAQQILLIAAAIIASTRISAYISEDLSKDIAKILPFTVLAMFILGNDFFNIDTFVLKISQIPSLFNNVLMFIIFIFIVEFILRGFHSIIQLIYSSESSDSGDKVSKAEKVESE